MKGIIYILAFVLALGVVSAVVPNGVVNGAEQQGRLTIIEGKVTDGEDNGILGVLVS